MKVSTQPDLERFITFLRAQKLPLEVQCDAWKAPRTLPQNAYLWSAVYGPLVERAGFSPEEWHDYFCQLHFGVVETVKPSGVVDYRAKRTTTRDENGKRDVLKGKAFSDFVTFVESECAKRGVFVETQWEAA